VGISRSNLYRLFEPEGGVARYIMAQRMRAAYAALADTDNHQPIHVVAESVGFAEAASFSRSFRREFGCKPRDLRQASRGAGRDAQAVGARQRVQSDLPALLRRL
jgi:AraC-like DNA-binding protein